MFNTLSVSLSTDLSEFSHLLWQRKIAHRIQEHGDQKFLLIADPKQAAVTLSLFQDWQRGTVKPAADDHTTAADLFNVGEFNNGILRAFLKAPFTLILIFVCIALAFLAPLDRPTDLTWELLYPDFSYGTRTIVLERVLQSFSFMQFLHMLTPILLHGGLIHLAFNMMWLWELGSRIEKFQSSLVMVATVVVLALISNTIQYLYGGGNNFGGMSGVVYGLFAYIWMWQLFDPRTGMGLPGSLIIFMLLSLVIMTALGLSMIANAAHMGGFLAGIVYGAITATISRVKRAMPSKEIPRD
ncbi:MAG: rhomboid family intramembrane serine protease [Pseudomonadota bacterium]